MATSSILTPSQSGIIGEGGRKVLKTRVQILGRFLLEPSQELRAEAAAQLTERAKSGRARVRTQLTLFSAGLRLGERGVFAAVPIEFVHYDRLSDLMASAKYPSVLLICVKDYEQRRATVVQFKDDVSLRVVVDVIARHRRAMDEDVGKISDLQSVGSGLRQSARGDGGGRDGGGEGNWRLLDARPSAAAAASVNGSVAAAAAMATTTDGVEQRDHRSAGAAFEESVLMDEDDYAVIRRSRLLAPTGAETQPPQRQQPAAVAVATTSSGGSGGGGGGDGGGSEAEKAAESPRRPPQQRWQQLELTSEQPQHRYQKNQHHQNHQQLQQRHSRTSWRGRGGGGGDDGDDFATVPDADANFEEVETAAIFETPDGPPTLLNELVRRRGVGSAGGGGSGGGGGGGGGGVDGREAGEVRSRVMLKVPPEFIARAKVTRRAADVANGASSQPPPPAEWASLDDRMGE